MSSLPTKSLHESSREKAYSIESSTASTSDLSSSSEIARSKIADNSEMGNSQLFVDNELQRCKMELQSRRSQKGNWHPSVAETLNKLGLFHLHMRNDLDVAEYYFNDALRILRQCKDLSMDNEIATTLSDIGNIYERRNNNVLALENYREALDTLRTIDPNVPFPEKFDMEHSSIQNDLRVYSILHRIDRLGMRWTL